MAPRYVVSSDNENYADSSPDPLSVAFNERQSRPTSMRTTKQQPLASTSPSRQNRRPKVSDLDLSSPTKEMLLSTPRTGGQSPWRIKVTVQAEPGSDSENISSPIVKHVMHTKTTKIPLKDAAASSPVKRRGRPRKSDTTTKRNATPVGKRATSKARRSSVSGASAADVETEATPKKRRGRPRKSQPPPEDDLWGQARQPSVGADASASTADVETDATPKKRRGRPRKSIQPPVDDEPAPVSEAPPLTSPAHGSAETELPDGTALEPTVADDIVPAMSHVSSPAAEPTLPTPQERRTQLRTTPTHTDLSRKIKARKNTPIAKIPIEISSEEESDAESNMNGETYISDNRHEYESEEAEPELDEPKSDDFEQQVPANETDEVDDDQHDETRFAFDEGTTRMPDDTTIIDSENFSMISVDSLPSCASVTRPTSGATGSTPSARGQIPVHNLSHLSAPDVGTQGGSPIAVARSSPAFSRTTLSVPRERPTAARRYKTPSEEPVDYSNPPPVEPARLDLTEAQTPKIGRVVKAGVALQGVLDPNRVTPETGPSKIVDEHREHLDNLFRGFSERTRRELHAGLRLGEQLAQQNASNKPSSPALSSSTKAAKIDISVAPSNIPQNSRLLTPEDQDDESAPAAEEADVEYPTLPTSDRSGLLSPVSSSQEEEDGITPSGPPGDQTSAQPPSSRTARGSARISPPDMWEEEASRSSIGPDNEAFTDDNPQAEDLFTQDGPAQPARGKLPGTWRRKSPSNFDYSGEAEESQVVTPPSTESDESPARKSDKGKGKMIQAPASEQDDDDQEGGSEASDDTGMFFQANIPNLYNKKRAGERRRRRKEKVDISLNLDQSLLPESSLLVASSPPPASKTPTTDKLNPFVNTPPHLGAARSSPVKSSPLRQELRGSDISSDSAYNTFEESTLPIAPSSPFRTFVEGENAQSMGSDERQFMYEMAGTNSSVRRIRDEADEYLDAYEPQERSLNDLTEYTEPNTMWNKDSTMLVSTPSKAPSKERIAHTSVSKAGSASKTSLSAKQTQAHCAPEPVVSDVTNKASTPTSSRTANKEPAQHDSDVPNSTPTPLPSAMRKTTSPPPAHPALAKLNPLPRVEPWTKTHYQALDKLYQQYKKQPLLFSPTAAPNAALNTTLLTNFLNLTMHNFIGARYRSWGYNVIFTDALVVLCAAYIQLLNLDSIEEYEDRAGKEIVVGDCAPRVAGDPITAEMVAQRLATVVIGEAVRRDERREKVVDKSGRLWVEWPEES